MSSLAEVIRIYTYILRLIHKYLSFACRGAIDRLVPHWLYGLSPTEIWKLSTVQIHCRIHIAYVTWL